MGRTAMRCSSSIDLFFFFSLSLSSLGLFSGLYWITGRRAPNQTRERAFKLVNLPVVIVEQSDACCKPPTTRIGTRATPAPSLPCRLLASSVMGVTYATRAQPFSGFVCFPLRSAECSAVLGTTTRQGKESWAHGAAKNLNANIRVQYTILRRISFLLSQ